MNLIPKLQFLLLKNSKVALSIAVIYFLCSAFLGMEGMDGFFHINQAILITGNLPFETILTSLTLKLLYVFFGQYYILYRLFNLFLFLISYFLIFTLVKNSFTTPFLRLMFACFIVLSTPMNFNILGYDSLSIFSISICIWFLLKYDIEKTFNIIVFAFFVAISGLIRLPNLVILLWLCLFFIDYRKRRMQNWRSLFYLYSRIGVISILFYFGFLILHYSSIHNITHSFASNRHHNVIKLLLRYFSDLYQICYYLLGFVFLFFISKIKKPRFLFFIALFVFLYSFINRILITTLNIGSIPSFFLHLFFH